MAKAAANIERFQQLVEQFEDSFWGDLCLKTRFGRFRTSRLLIARTRDHAFLRGALFLLGVCVHAQTFVEGSVRDAAGAAIPKSDIVLQRQGTNIYTIST